MRTKILFVLTSISLNFSSQAQEGSKKMRISEFHLQNGMGINSTQNLTLSDFQNLAPNSILLQNDLSGFNSNAYGMYNGYYSYGPGIFARNRMLNTSSYQSLQLGITFKDNPNPIWRIGISHGSTSTLSSGYSKDFVTRFDTLTSSQTGEEFYVDSVRTKNYFMQYNAEQLHLETSLIYRTNPEARWSLYAGIGASFGFSYNAETNINYNSYRYISGVSSSTTSSSDDESESESFTNKSNFSTSLFLPMGINFRMGKNKEFWKRLHMYYEMKPAINITSIPELKTYTSVIMTGVLGLKVTF
jgi:hypothetical protein